MVVVFDNYFNVLRHVWRGFDEIGDFFVHVGIRFTIAVKPHSFTNRMDEGVFFAPFAFPVNENEIVHGGGMGITNINADQVRHGVAPSIFKLVI
ncbi:hypothetical protein D3C80_1438370 [compost metagenome]